MVSAATFACVLASLAATASANATASATEAASARIESCSPGVWALTFDDGPAQFTDELLDTLRAEGVKATFFVVGSMLGTENVPRLQRAYKEGHQIGIHTFNHKSLNNLDEQTSKQEMWSTEDKIVKAIGVAPRYMRPPYGECNEECVAEQKDLGYTVTMWNVDSRDWDVKGDGKKMIHNILRYGDGLGPVAKTTDQHGVISLQHDVNDVSVEVTPKIIQHLKREGFKFATVAECGPNRPKPYRAPRTHESGDDSPPSQAVPDATKTEAPPAQPVGSPTADKKNEDEKKDGPNSGADVPAAAGPVIGAVTAAVAVMASRSLAG